MINLNKYYLQCIKLTGIVLMILSYNFYTEGDGLIFLVFMIGSVILYAMIPLIERREVQE
ncbi:hypothetical protein LCGC14_1254850 [marine sediment metagenome]|uniref:Uncharacterized protein n=1 Tax=marine sediment metagenome TaxID=412755 RepID=A0A0F9L2F8_9ZZZZ